MASLSDQIDRLTRNTRAIKSTTAHAAASVDGPFTRAVLSASLGDLIRDIDPSELGLFSLPESEPVISRAEFIGATPLKKPHLRRDDAQKQKDYDPEIYAQAALKCIDRYQAVRPMPRAHAQVVSLLERLNIVRENIRDLSETLQQAQTAEGPPLKSLIYEEEERVQSLQAHLNALHERKNNATIAKTRPKVKSTLPRPNPQPKAHPPPSSPQEDSFWNTPANTARTLRFTDNIMDTESLIDEQVDLGDVSSASFASPIVTSRTSRLSSLVSPDESVVFSSMNATPSHEDQTAEEEDEGSDHDYGGDDSGKVDKISLSSGSQTPQKPPLTPGMQEVSPDTQLLDTPDTKPFKIKINGEVERISSKIWTTISDLIMPGHSFDATRSGTGTEQPRAKEIIAHLQSLSALSPPPTSPSVSSVSSVSAMNATAPNAQQILTAHMLLTLMMNPPQYALPVNKVKDLLAAKAGGAVSMGTTRIMYGCVAKRLVKIDRSGGEQILKFDV